MSDRTWSGSFVHDARFAEIGEIEDVCIRPLALPFSENWKNPSEPVLDPLLHLQPGQDWERPLGWKVQPICLCMPTVGSLSTASVWGNAQTASSDGQRFLFPRKTARRIYSHRMGDYALEFYSFIADNYAPFYSVPIECSERDAAYVLDGLLYHEADLDIDEHYTDTHGYTEANFAAFAMLGKRFSPRIRGLHKQRIYQADSQRDYGALQAMLAGEIAHYTSTGSRTSGTGWLSSSARWRLVTPRHRWQ